MPDKPTIYRITHLWPNKQPGHGSRTAQIQQERWTIYVCDQEAGGCGLLSADQGTEPDLCWHCDEPTATEVEVVPAADRSSTVQIKPETDEPNALPSRFVSLQDYEALEREGRATGMPTKPRRK